MPYQSISELPEGVQNNLPEHAQEIYKEAFNNAYKEYAEPSERRGNDDQETVAHKVAWSAVKEKYEKNDQGDWVKK